MFGIIGKKIGMTRYFDKISGEYKSVTMIEVKPNVVHQMKTVEKDGYAAFQLGYDHIEERKLTKPLIGHFKKLNTTPTRVIKEFDSKDPNFQVTSGSTVGIEILDTVKYVDIIGTSKGKGYTGTIKRHNFQRGRMTHGNTNRREPGSIGSNTFPSHVWPGKRMAGQCGNEQVTIKGLEIVHRQKDDGYIFVKGAIPGRNKGIVFIRVNTVKAH